MRTKISPHTNALSIFFILLFWILSLGSGKSQSAFLAYNLPSPYNSSGYWSDIFQYSTFTYRRLGIGINTPEAKLHIKEPLLTFPVFKVEGTFGQTQAGVSIKHLFYNNSIDTLFGIYQSGYDLINFYEGVSYFKNSIGCYASLDFDGTNSGISATNAGSFPFSISASPSSLAVTQLEIFLHDKVQVKDTLECENILIHNNAAAGRVLVSNQRGQGNWTDASLFNDNDWLVSSINEDTEQHSLYANPIYSGIGIGTSNPTNKLHVVNGNILVSRTSENGSGSILFGNIVNTSNPNGKWGIQYSSKGLNFWNIANGDTSLFLNDDMTVGIGCSDTRDFKLAVKGKILCTEVLVRKYDNWPVPDYVFNENYKLLPLKDVEIYIAKNRHLPDIPSSDEINKNGMNLSDMNCALLKKVEELTLYIIEQQKQIDDLKNKVGNW